MKYIFVLLILAMNVRSSLATLPVDDFEDGNATNAGSGIWTSYTDGYSVLTFAPNSAPGCNGSTYCAKLILIGRAGAINQYGGIVSPLNSQNSKVNLTGYEGIRFRARGTGNLEVQLPTTATSTEYNHYQCQVKVTADWKLYEISFKSFTQTWGTPQILDTAEVLGTQFNITTTVGDSGAFYIDNIEFFKYEEYINSPYAIIPYPKINQLGYLPSAPKIFAVAFPYASPGKEFTIIEEPAGNTAYAGNLNTIIIDDSLSTGEHLLTGDFSSLTKEGTYYILVDTFKSEPFQINAKVYQVLMQEALRTFYINRCGIEIQDPHTGIQHGACHRQDTLIRGSNFTRDFTGAWHNAGDFGKWTHMNAINISYFLWAYSLHRNSFLNLTINIPESVNGIPDILDEARWGLDWLFKMQNADGSVYHKVDTEPDFVPGKRPDQDTLKRYASFQKADNQTPSDIDAADFVAVMLQAYRVFLPADSPYAVRCRDAAMKTWRWLQSAPVTGQTDPYYPDSDPFQERLWAKCEMYCATKDQTLLNDLLQDINSRPVENIYSDKPQALGYLSVYLDPASDPGLKNIIAEEIKNFADKEIAKIAKSGYRVAMEPWEYSWESNESVVHKGNMFIMAYLMTDDTQYMDHALDQLHYLLGRNALNLSFVSGFGGNSVRHPYHWANLSRGIALPGWTAGGPNQYPTNVDALLLAKQKLILPPAKCFVDDLSYGCNEGETTEAAALAFLSGFFF